MADVQLLVPGVEAAPLIYTVPDTSEIILKAAGATFDGSAAAGAFLPAIVITPPSGVPLPPFITDTAVAAGASAEVAFAPFLRSGGGASTPTVVGFAYGRFTAAQTATSGVELILTTASFATNDATRFADIGNGIACTGSGLYYVGALVDWQAGNYAKSTYLSNDNMSSFPYQFTAGTAITQFADGAIAVNPVAAGNPTIHFTQLIVNNTSNFNARARVFQATGVNKTLINAAFAAPLYSQCIFAYYIGPTA